MDRKRYWLSFSITILIIPLRQVFSETELFTYPRKTSKPQRSFYFPLSIVAPLGLCNHVQILSECWVCSKYFFPVDISLSLPNYIFFSWTLRPFNFVLWKVSYMFLIELSGPPFLKLGNYSTFVSPLYLPTLVLGTIYLCTNLLQIHLQTTKTPLSYFLLSVVSTIELFWPRVFLSFYLYYQKHSFNL